MKNALNYEQKDGEAAQSSPVAAIDAQPQKSKKAYYLIKRVFDIVFSVVALIVSIIPMLIISLLVVQESSGAPFYVHNRIGRNGKPLRVLKFRTMYANADQMVESFTPEQKAEWEENFKLNDDPRITKVGKFLRRSSLDELPQLWNIIKGEMSVVGPRPVVAEELERYGDSKDKFLSAPPGLTGYWQAYARSTCSYEQRIQMELRYVENANFWWDIKIILKTVEAVLHTRGAK